MNIMEALVFKLYALSREIKKKKKIDGHSTQEYKQVSAICSPLMLKLWPMDHQWSGRCRLLTLVILSPWWKVTKSKHVFYSYHRNSRWSSVVLQEVGGRKDPQITSLLRIHRKDGKKRKKKSRDGKNRKREQRKRGEVEIGEWIHKYFFTTHFFLI